LEFGLIPDPAAWRRLHRSPDGAQTIREEEKNKAPVAGEGQEEREVKCDEKLLH